MERVNIHATGLLLGDHGVVILGPSGSGKSLLALDLLGRWAKRGEAALLVADDRLDLEVRGERLFMHAPATIAGLIELRGRGIVRRSYVGEAPVHLIVELVETLERMPEEVEFRGAIAGVSLPRCPVPRRGITDPTHQFLLVDEGLRQLRGSEFDI